MTIKPVKSTDPQKAKVVAAFKTLFGCRKVTNVRVVSCTDTFSVRYIADCMNFDCGADMILRDRRILKDRERQTWQIDYSNPGVEE